MLNKHDEIITLWAELEYVRKDWYHCIISEKEANQKREEIHKRLRELGEDV